MFLCSLCNFKHRSKRCCTLYEHQICVNYYEVKKTTKLVHMIVKKSYVKVLNVCVTVGDVRNLIILKGNPDRFFSIFCYC